MMIIIDHDESYDDDDDDINLNVEQMTENIYYYAFFHYKNCRNVWAKHT